MSSYYKFKKNDKIINYITSYPYYKFSIYDASVYLNTQNSYVGAFTDQIGEVPPGFISLYELNVDRDFSAHTFDLCSLEDPLVDVRGEAFELVRSCLRICDT